MEASPTPTPNTPQGQPPAAPPQETNPFKALVGDKPLTSVILGNDAPMMQYSTSDDAGNTITTSARAEHIEHSETRVVMEPGFDDQEFVNLSLSTDNDRNLKLIARSLDDAHKKYAIGVQQLDQIISIHSGNSKPTWVASSDPEFAKALADYFECPIGQPTMLLTNNGRDNIHSCSFNTGAQPASANFMALTANATAAAATDTTLTGEIVTASGGLIRAQATYAHTAGTNTTTLTKTFTANGNDALPVTIAKIGIFNASSAGTMVFETLLNSTATLNVSGDNVTITETITAG